MSTRPTGLGLQRKQIPCSASVFYDAVMMRAIGTNFWFGCLLLGLVAACACSEKKERPAPELAAENERPSFEESLATAQATVDRAQDDVDVAFRNLENALDEASRDAAKAEGEAAIDELRTRRKMLKAVQAGSKVAPKKRDCGASEGALLALLVKSQRCEIDDDCVTIALGCPFGCSTPVSSKSNLALLRKRIAEHDQDCKRCKYTCRRENRALLCGDENLCQFVSQENLPAP